MLILADDKTKYFLPKGWTSCLSGTRLICPSGSAAGWVEPSRNPSYAQTALDGVRFRLRSVSFGGPGRSTRPTHSHESAGRAAFAVTRFDCQAAIDLGPSLRAPAKQSIAPAKQKAGLLPPSLVELRRTRSSQTLACANASRLSQAMTPEQDMHPHSRRARCARALRQLPPSLRKRAQGKPGARCTRGLVCKLHKKMRTRAYRSSGGIPAFPARWFTAYFALSPVNGLSCHRRP